MDYLVRLFLVLVTAWLVAACATIKSGIDEGLRPDGGAAVVFGRIQASLNGIDVGRKSTTSAGVPTAMTHVSRFTTIAEVNANSFAPGQFAIKTVVDEKGYFAVSLPPGRYYLVEFIFSDMLPIPIALRTYMPILGGTIHRQVIYTFEVESGTATYIGSLHHHFRKSENGYDWRLTVTDETQAVGRWMAEKHPAWSTRADTKLLKALSKD